MDILYVILILFLGFLIPFTINNKFSKVDIKILNVLWLYHIGASIFSYFYTRNWGGDSWVYWIDSQEMTSADFINGIFSSQGTVFVTAFNYIFANIMGMGFFSNTLLYGLFGFIALTFFYQICIQTVPYNSKFYKIRLFPLLLFLPNLNVWSSSISKDALMLLCISMVTYGFTHISKRFPLIVFGLLLSYAIRPHVTLILLISFGLIYAINTKINAIQRIVFIICIAAAIVFILPKVLDFVKIDELSVNELDQFSDRLSTSLARAKSGVDISSYPYPLKVLTFLYRPFFFDINGVLAVIASFENLLVLLLSIAVLRSRFFATFRAAPLIVQGLFLFFIIGTLVFSMSLGNLGIILRERNMFVPGLILFILWSFSYKQEFVMKKRNNLSSFILNN